MIRGNANAAARPPAIVLNCAAPARPIRPESTIDFFQKLRAQGVKTELHLLQGAPHAYVRNNPDATLLSAQAANLFFDRLVISPRANRVRAAPPGEQY